ncbi:MAG: dTDP-glucose 4,6-dehydratase [Deltaproteobacteria bacterium]|nr:dTDP-glucose 4,6-dehydratase [Deltaproteobacteria bacterium]
MTKNILVTGGCGFIGCNFIRHLLHERTDVHVINLDKLTYAGNVANLRDVERNYPDRYRFVKGDIADRETVEALFSEEQITWVVHFAAESHVDRSIASPDAFIQTNIYGTFVLLEACRKYWPLESQEDLQPYRFLHISTDEVYGSLGESGYFTENTPYDPSSPYSASKAASDHLVRAYFKTYGLPAIITNCSNNYGPFQFPEKFIPLAINNARTGKEIPVYGDGLNIRDWLYVEDHCRALLLILEKAPPGEHFNIGGHCEKRNLELVHQICDYMDEKLGMLSGRSRRELIRFVKDRPSHDRRYAIDDRKLREKLGWNQTVSFEDGLKKTVDWYLEHIDWITEVTG